MSTSNLPIENVGSYSYIFLANWNEYVTVYSFLVKGFNMGTKNFANLNVGACKADIPVQNGGQASTCWLYALQSPYIIPSIVPTASTDLRFFTFFLFWHTARNQLGS